MGAPVTQAHDPDDSMRLERLLHGSVTVLGCAVAGFGAAAGLLGSARFAGTVCVLDSRDDDELRSRGDILEALGGDVRLDYSGELPDGTDLLVVSPGIPLNHPLLAQARACGVEVVGEVELAWRLRPVSASADAPWLVVTGTNGKTTTTRMLHTILTAAGVRSAAVGNIGASIVDTIMDPVGYDVFAVEVSAQQLPFVTSMSPLASVVLNIAPDHLDYFATFDDYRRTKARAYERTRLAALWNVSDPQTEAMLRDSDVVEGCRAIGVTLGVPAPSMLGIVEDMLVDRAFLEERHSHAVPLAQLADVVPTVPHNVFNALAAAGLARAFGVGAAAVAQGLRGFTPDAHRMTVVAQDDGITWVDDSKATNAHAVDASMRAHERIVWLAGGLAKGQQFDDLVRTHAARLRGAVLWGADRERIAHALAAHAPHVPVVLIAVADGEAAIREAVAAAANIAGPGDAVLLAPGCSSWDLFPGGYAQRGEMFTGVVREHLRAGR